jgi:hypothetical protein
MTMLRTISVSLENLTTQAQSLPMSRRKAPILLTALAIRQAPDSRAKAKNPTSPSHPHLDIRVETKSLHHLLAVTMVDMETAGIPMTERKKSPRPCLPF